MRTKKKALLIVDVLVGISQLPEPLSQEDRFLACLEGLLARAREGGVVVVYLQHCGPAGSLFARGTREWQIHPRLAPEPTDIVIEKSNPDSFHRTGLDEMLKARGIEELYVCGFATEGCVDTTVRSAYSKDYSVILVADGHTTTKNAILSAEQIIQHHNTLLARFARVQYQEEITFDD